MKNQNLIIGLAAGAVAIAAGVYMSNRNKPEINGLKDEAKNLGGSFKDRFDNVKQKAKKEYQNAKDEGEEFANNAKERAEKLLQKT